MLMSRLPGSNNTHHTHHSNKHKSNNNNCYNKNYNNIRGGGANTTVAAHTKMRLLSKVEQNLRQQQQQNQSVNKLITTAATGNGVVGDVDGLLTPLRKQQTVAQQHSGKDARPERNLWSRVEMLEMLYIMQQLNAVELLNDRNVKSEVVFRQIEEIMHSKGYVKKSSIQIWTKWKFLKSTYNTTRRQGSGAVPKVVPVEVYRVLCKMLRSNVDDDGGSDCNNSTHSMDHDMVQSKLNGSSGDQEQELGVEHPIFGFRLGPIKPEPVDTGYETIVNYESSSERDTLDWQQGQSLDHTPFLEPIKHEPDMDVELHSTNTPPPTAPASPSPPAVQQQFENGQIYASTPLAAQVPPLRVAAFAKDAPQRQATHGVLHIERPPALVKPQTTKGVRALPLPNTNSINFVQPMNKLMLPKLQSSTAGKAMTMRLPRDITLQPAGMRQTSLNVANNAMRLKQVPMRQTAYSLRPERMIPDLDQSISPPQSPSPTPNPPVPTLLMRAQPHMHQSEFSVYSNATPTMSRQAQELQQRNKRRLTNAPQPVPVKLQRSAVATALSSSQAMYAQEKQLSDEKMIGNKNFEKSSEFEDFESKKLNIEQEKRKQDEQFEKELGQLASALRATQKEMMQEFFAQQKDIARREHEFQLRQDAKVMRALRKQTNALIRTANELMQQVNGAAGAPEVPQAEQEVPNEDEHNSADIAEPEIGLQIDESAEPEAEEQADPNDEEEDLQLHYYSSDNSRESANDVTATTASDDSQSADMQ